MDPGTFFDEKGDHMDARVACIKQDVSAVQAGAGFGLTYKSWKSTKVPLELSCHVRGRGHTPRGYHDSAGGRASLVTMSRVFAHSCALDNTVEESEMAL